MSHPEPGESNMEEIKSPPGIEPGTFCVLGRRDNHYTTETEIWSAHKNEIVITVNIMHFLSYKFILRRTIHPMLPTTVAEATWTMNFESTENFLRA